ncbi:MAG: efflux RND transporter periplasmic adaptor subunit [Gemmatimonadales bacterium]|nr:efflux RND transporter periplasmic adaptor subunit [Gemmatimonadales bacterium]
MRTFGPEDLLVIDLDDPSQMPDPRRLLSLLSHHDIWLAYGDRTIAARWLDTIHWPNLYFVHCDGMDRAAGLRTLVSSVLQRVVGPTAQDLTSLVLARDPGLAPARELTQAVCERPWDIRWPAQLAAAVGRPLRAIKRALHPLGFSRVEHFITFVRWVAFEQLVAVRRLSVSRAKRLAGIADSSNLRRQLARVRTGSPLAARRLQAHIAALALVLALVAGACRDRAEGQNAEAAEPAGRRPDSAIALPVVGALVRRGDLVLTIRTTGEVRAERQVLLKSETQGTVAAVLVRSGNRVDSGQVLVRLDPRPLDLAVREAEAQLADAMVRYGDILLGDDTTSKAPEALERRRNARLRAGVGGAEARLERAQLEREGATVRAPFGGTVDQIQVVAGQQVAAGDPIVMVVDLGSLLVEAAVLEHDLPLIRRGATAVVSLVAGRDRSFEGRVTVVLPIVDTTTRTGRALVRLRSSDGVLRPGMYADVRLEATRLSDRVIVPAPAIIERDGRPLVFRYRGGKAEWVYVTPGRSNGRETEVLPDTVVGRTPVAVGDTVLIEGHLTLTHDAPVRLLAEEQ